MSPSNMIDKALELGINVLGITDHNSTLNAETAKQIGLKKGVHVLMGAEVTTKEEVHCLCFMPDVQKLAELQKILDANQTFFENSPSKFGYQFVVDENENIIDEIPHLLINALNITIKDLSFEVKKLGGIFIPAHVDKKVYSISSQLGIIPDNIYFDILELSPFAYKNNFFEKFPWFKEYKYITNSDAHYIRDMGKTYNIINTPNLDFENIRTALKTAKPIFI